jgi:prepilin-type N-terminal cleavage/methylation domain-containing protein
MRRFFDKDRMSANLGRPGQRRADERGDTLIELLLALTIIAIVVAAIMDGLVGASSGSTVYRGMANVDTLAKSYLDAVVQSIQSSTTLYQGCPTPTPATYTTAVSLPAAFAGTAGSRNGMSVWLVTSPPAYGGYSVGVIQVIPTSNATFSSTTTTTTTGSCSDYGIQQVIVSATAPDGTTAQLDGTVRNPTYEPCYESLGHCT